MTEEQLDKRYNESRSENVAVRFVDGDIITGKLDSFTSGVNNEPDEASIYVGEYELYASEIVEIREI